MSENQEVNNETEDSFKVEVEDDTPPFDVDEAPAPTTPVEAKPSSQRAEDILAMIRNRKSTS